MAVPLLENKQYDAQSIFTAENMLREARRQKSLVEGVVPAICILDPDGDLAHYLNTSGQAEAHPTWACYHTRLYTFEHESIQYGIVPYAVGASFAVLVAEELFASGCQLLVSMTSAGQIISMGQPPYFVLIDRALRDEGTSYHYLPSSDYSHANPDLLDCLQDQFEGIPQRVIRGASWTTDAPFRETEGAIAYAQAQAILGVEMEAAALYAYAQAARRNVICFAHITNQMAQVEGDFEKGMDQGSHDALAVIHRAASRWLGQ